MPSSAKSFLPLLEHAAETLVAAFEDDAVAATISDRDEWSMLSRRLPELAVEELEALDVLCRNEMWRPAHALLRGLLECVATMLWIARGPEDAPARFAAGGSPSAQKLLGAVGWSVEYDRTFRLLSDMTHPTAAGAEAYRWYDEERSIHAPAPEITADMELYVVGSFDDAVSVPVRALSPQQLRDEYEPYIAAKAFDIILSGLVSLHGEERCRTAAWWPSDALDLFALALQNHPATRERMLWSGAETDSAWPQLRLDDDQR